MSISGYSDVAMVVFGVLLLIAGLTLLAARPDAASGPFLRPRRAASLLISRHITEPTRLAIAVVLLVVGYHFLIWAAPARWGALGIPRRRWLLLVGIGAAVVVISLLLDRVSGVTGRAPGGGRGEHGEDPQG